jgi:hypothetical protein
MYRKLIAVLSMFLMLAAMGMASAVEYQYYQKVNGYDVHWSMDSETKVPVMVSQHANGDYWLDMGKYIPGYGYESSIVLIFDGSAPSYSSNEIKDELIDAMISTYPGVSVVGAFRDINGYVGYYGSQYRGSYTVYDAGFHSEGPAGLIMIRDSNSQFFAIMDSIDVHKCPVCYSG